MPTYAKLPKVTSDYAVGIATVNQLRDNLDLTQAAAIIAHGHSEPLSLGRPRPPPRPQQMGHHSDARIPRSSLAVLSTVFPGSLSMVDMRTADPHVTTVTRLAAGVVRFDVRDLATFWGHGVPHATSTASVRFIDARSYLGSNGQPPCVIAYSYDLAAGAFTPTDYDYTLHLYGSP